MKNKNPEFKITDIKSKSLYIFIDESGIYRYKEINNKIKEYEKKGIISNSGSAFSMSAVSVKSNSIKRIISEVNKLKKNYQILDKNIHRNEYSYSRFVREEKINQYIDIMNFFHNYINILNKHKVKTFSSGHNFKYLYHDDKLTQLKGKDIYVENFMKLVNTVLFYASKNKKLRDYNIYFVLEDSGKFKSAKNEFDLKIRQKHKKIKLLKTLKNNIGNEMCDIITYNNHRYYETELFHSSHHIFHSFPRHYSKTLKINNIKKI